MVGYDQNPGLQLPNPSLMLLRLLPCGCAGQPTASEGGLLMPTPGCGVFPRPSSDFPGALMGKLGRQD